MKMNVVDKKTIDVGVFIFFSEIKTIQVQKRSVYILI